MRHLSSLLILASFLSANGCDGRQAASGTKSGPTPASAPAPDKTPVYGYEVVNTFPHDPAAYTQGLIFHEGALLESTGLEGQSTLRRVELRTGRVLQKVDVPGFYFAEGMTMLAGKVYQLTWKGEKGFVYDPASFAKLGEFEYEGEGWGLTHDGDSLILSDGSETIRFLDPATSQVRRSITVRDRGRVIDDLNELEYVKGEIFANVWHDNRVARIDPQTGLVRGWIDLTGLLKPGEVKDPEAVLNGIAYDAQGDRLFVTGKLWPKLFEIKLKQK